jgi:hypothetical protein
MKPSAGGRAVHSPIGAFSGKARMTLRSQGLAKLSSRSAPRGFGSWTVGRTGYTRNYRALYAARPRFRDTAHRYADLVRLWLGVK